MTVKGVERKVFVPELLGKVSPEMSKLHEVVKTLAEAHNHHDDQLNRQMRGGTSASNNSKVRYFSATLQMPADAPWLSITPLLGTWAQQVSFQPPQYLMEPGGLVRTRGDVDSGAAAHVADLPLGYAPPEDTHLGPDTATAMLVTGGAIGPGLYLPSLDGSLHASWLASPNAAPPHVFPAPWPIIIKHPWQQCLGLSVDACREETQNARSTYGAPVPDWQDRGDGSLQLNGLWGLCWGKRYTVRFRLSAEEA